MIIVLTKPSETDREIAQWLLHESHGSRARIVPEAGLQRESAAGSIVRDADARGGNGRCVA